jgi:hypothetical protein
MAAFFFFFFFRVLTVFARLSGPGHVLVGNELPETVRGRQFQVFERHSELKL